MRKLSLPIELAALPLAHPIAQSSATAVSLWDVASGANRGADCLTLLWRQS